MQRHGAYFSEAELYHEITQLSYRGDIRMSIGEDPKKVRSPSLGLFGGGGNLLGVNGLNIA